MKHLYNLVLGIMADIEQIESCINEIKNQEGAPINSNFTIRTEQTINSSLGFANVRKSTYVQFLQGELKEHQKDLKVVESKIKSKLEGK